MPLTGRFNQFPADHLLEKQILQDLSRRQNSRRTFSFPAAAISPATAGLRNRVSTFRAFFHRLHQVTGHAIFDLQPDPARIAAITRVPSRALPPRLIQTLPAAISVRSRQRLSGSIDLQVGDAIEIGHHLDIVISRPAERWRGDTPPIIGRHRADEASCTLGSPDNLVNLITLADPSTGQSGKSG